MKKHYQLYEIPEGSKIYAPCGDGSTYIIFHHLDGMYSYCTTEKGGVAHLAGFTPVIEEGGDYFIE